MGGRAAAWPGAVVYAEGRAGLRLAEPGVQGLCAPVVFIGYFGELSSCIL